jgi:hypothetical protein
MAHLVEIDLLRSGLPMLKVAKEEHDYMTLVSRAEMRPQADWYPFSLREPIPAFRLPLQEDDDEPFVNLNTILHELYDRAGHDLRINYRAEPTPPLDEDNRVWADQTRLSLMLEQQGIERMIKQVAPPLDQLFTLGNVHSREPWQDYHALGITKVHVPALIGIATDLDLNWADENSQEVWAPLQRDRRAGADRQKIPGDAWADHCHADQPPPSL